MNFGRILANAFARRIAFVIVALLFVWMGIGAARAQDYPLCASTNDSAACGDQGSAALGLQAAISDENITGYKLCGPTITATAPPPGTTRVSYFKVTPATACTSFPSYWQIFHRTYPTANSCSARPTQTVPRLPLAGSLECINGCMTAYAPTGDDETSIRSPNGSICTNTKDNCPAGFFHNVMMNVCQPVVPTCPEGQERVDGVCKPKNTCPDGMVAVLPSTPGAIASGALYCSEAGNECPAGNIKAPSGQCLPGEGQCAAGEAKKKDGTCGKDADEDGIPDSEDEDTENDPDKESFSGGDSCDVPPSCEGGPIDCGMARIQWRIDCNTRRNVNISGGNCSNVPICTGEKCNAMEYAQLLQTWKTACAVEKLANKPPGEGDDNTNGQFDNAPTAGILGSDGYTGDTGKTVNDGDIEFSTSGFGYGNTCPSMPTIEVFGTSITLDTDGVFCDWMRLGGIFVMIMAHLAGLAIVIRS